MAHETLHWDRPFKTVHAGGFETGDIIWFPEGGLNASYNCVDHWAFKHPNNVNTVLLIYWNFTYAVHQIAIIYEADEPEDGCLVTYAELLREVCSIANVLKSLGVKKGDTVSVYLPMMWQSVAAFLACARIGAVHSVVFAGFSAESLRDRVQECKLRVVHRYHVQSLTHLQSHPALAMRSVQKKSYIILAWCMGTTYQQSKGRPHGIQ